VSFAAHRPFVALGGLVKLEVSICGGGGAQRRRSACISFGVIGVKPRAILRPWWRTSRESMPPIVVTPEIPWHKRPEIALVTGGVEADVLGDGLDEIPAGDRDAVLGAYP